jgi:mycothiol system anti-sigma-R factor
MDDHDDHFDLGVDCDEAVHTLYDFLDGELTAERKAHIQAHLEECSPCLDAFDFEAELKLLVARKCRDQVPEALRIRIAAILANERAQRPFAPG